MRDILTWWKRCDVAVAHRVRSYKGMRACVFTMMFIVGDGLWRTCVAVPSAFFVGAHPVRDILMCWKRCGVAVAHRVRSYKMLSRGVQAHKMYSRRASYDAPVAPPYCLSEAFFHCWTQPVRSASCLSGPSRMDMPTAAPATRPVGSMRIRVG